MKRAMVIGYLIFAAVGLLWICASSLADQPDPGKTSSVRMVNLELVDVSVKDAIEKLFAGTGLKYTLRPGVSGRVVELRLKGLTFEQAFEALMEAARLTYKVEDGTYVIGPAEAETSVSKPKGGEAAGSDARKPEEAQAQTPGTQPQAAEVEKPATSAQQGAPTEQAAPAGPSVESQQPAPVFYGHPAPLPYDFPYGLDLYPLVYQYGGVRILGSRLPIVIAGGNPQVVRHGPIPLPPIGYVSPEVLRFLRTQWAMQNHIYIAPY